MAAEDVIAQVKQISGILHAVSVFPGLSVLAVEANALDSLAANPEFIQKIYDGVETGISVIQAIVQVMRDNNLNDAVHYLTSWAPRG